MKCLMIFILFCCVNFLLLVDSAYSYMYKLEFIHQDAPSERSTFMLFEDGKTISAKIYYKDGWEESFTVKEVSIVKGEIFKLKDLFSDIFFEKSFNHGGISWLYIIVESDYPPVSKKGYRGDFYAGPDAIIYKNGNLNEKRKSGSFLNK